MIIKQKSLVVALISSFVISLVLALTLVGYLAYIEIKGEEFKRRYHELLQKANAKVYSRYIEISKLRADMEIGGVLKGMPIIEGIIKNNGYKDITSLLINIKFLDRDGAIIYEETFYPQEPSLGASSLPRAPFSYLHSSTKVILKPNSSLPFKRILSSCPAEIVKVLREGTNVVKSSGRWSGRLIFEVLAIEF